MPFNAFLAKLFYSLKIEITCITLNLYYKGENNNFLSNMTSISISNNDNKIQKTLQWIADAGINGLGVLPSAEQVAKDYFKKAAKKKSLSCFCAIKQLIKSSK